MPRGDRTGPLGEGPLTGRRMGYCAGEDQPGYMFTTGYGFRRGRNQGTGFGKGYRRSWGGSPLPLSENMYSGDVQQINALRYEVADLKKKLNQVLEGFNNLMQEKGTSVKKQDNTKK